MFRRRLTHPLGENGGNCYTDTGHDEVISEYLDEFTFDDDGSVGNWRGRFLTQMLFQEGHR